MALPVRRQYKGAAASTTTTINIGPADTSVSIAANTGWPSSAGVPFYVVLSPGTSAEEKCLATISGTSLTLTRAQDDTTAQTHASGSVIYPVFTADDADEANLIASKMTTKGDLLTTDGSDINRLGVGTNAHALIADSTVTNGVKWGQLATGGITDSAVTTAKIADANVTAVKLATDSVETVKIKDLNVTTAKIADGAVTGVKLAATAAIQPTIVDAKGDLIAGTGSDTVDRLAVGTNGYVLTADSAQATGLKWAANPTPVMSIVKSDTIASGASGATVSAAFTSEYTHYRVLIHNISVAAGTPNVLFQLRTGSTTANTSYYYGGTNSNYVNRTDVQAANTSSWIAGYANTSAASTIDCMIYQPYEAAITNYYSLAVAGANASLQIGGTHNSATSYDQLVISLSTATTFNATATILIIGIKY